MKLKRRDIWGSQEALPRLLGRELPAKAAYWIGRNAKRVESASKDINDFRKDLVKKYGREDEKSKAWDVLPENREAFITELEKFLDTEIDIELVQITLADLGDIKLSASECKAIDFMLQEGK